MKAQKKSAPQQLTTGYIEFGPSLTEDDLYGRSSTAIGIARPIDVLPFTYYPDKESALAAKRQPEPAAPPPPPPMPQSAPSIFTLDKFPKARPDATAIVADEPELKEWVTPDFLHLTTAQILDAYLDPDDTVCAAIVAHGPQTGRYKELRNRLQNFSALDPNPLKVGEPPARKIW